MCPGDPHMLLCLPEGHQFCGAGMLSSSASRPLFSLLTFQIQIPLTFLPHPSCYVLSKPKEMYSVFMFLSSLISLNRHQNKNKGFVHPCLVGSGHSVFAGVETQQDGRAAVRGLKFWQTPSAWHRSGKDDLGKEQRPAGWQAGRLHWLVGDCYLREI